MVVVPEAEQRQRVRGVDVGDTAGRLPVRQSRLKSANVRVIREYFAPHSAEEGEVLPVVARR